MLPNYFKWFQMASNHSKWFRMISNAFKWVQLNSDERALHLPQSSFPALESFFGISKPMNQPTNQPTNRQPNSHPTATTNSHPTATQPANPTATTNQPTAHRPPPQQHTEGGGGSVFLTIQKCQKPGVSHASLWRFIFIVYMRKKWLPFVVVKMHK